MDINLIYLLSGWQFKESVESRTRLKSIY